MITPHFVSDQELMTRSQAGDHAAFTALYRRYWRKLLLIAWNHTNDKFAAEDVVHEVFMSLWNKQCNIEIINVGGFLTTKLKFLILENYRKQKRRDKIRQLNFLFADIVNEEEKLDAQFLTEYINGIVEELPEKCKLTFKYSREMGLKNSEIANAMHISEKGVERNLTRALKIIKNSIEAAGIIAAVFPHDIFKIFKP